MDASVLGFVAAALAVVRGVIAAVQKETVSWLTIVGVFVLGVATALGNIKFG